jgi:hypothetical protein
VDVVHHLLPDGSVCRVEQREPTRSLISRYVGDLCVWGQVFARREDHEGQVRDVVDAMKADPTAFERWWCPVTGADRGPAGRAIGRVIP